MTPQRSFEDIARAFADSVAADSALRRAVAAQPEDQLKAPVRDLLRDAGEAWGIEVASRTEAQAGGIGRPDLGVTAGGLLCGYVELKAPGSGAQPERFRGRDREQWERFQRLPNLIYTDGSEWSLYRNGKPVGARVRLAADVGADGARGVEAAALPQLEALLRDFLQHQPVAPSTARGLAEFLAPLARLLRDEVREALDREGGAVRQIAGEWRGVLFADAEPDQFADAYAQTVTYALLLARFEGADELREGGAVAALRQAEYDVMASVLNWLEQQRVRDELSMPIQLLERAIAAVDAQALLAERDGEHEIDRDPWLYFYEDFLAAYNPDLRQSRGVYYTPVEVVRAQVRFTAELLASCFSKPLGFADDGVVVLDPACGTGAYPLAVIEHAKEKVHERLGEGAVPNRLSDLAERLHAFEILVGPYAVAQTRIARRLRELGVADRNPLVYLADTLESPNLQSRFPHMSLYETLTLERERARRVKREERVFVCLGNPPYDREQRDPDADDGGRRKGGWVRYGDEDDDAPPLLEDFLRPVRDAGGGGHLKNLYNDYVYFWRWALWKVFDSTRDGGIVTFITASSYLRGPAFAGMRHKMREVFDELWIIDLEGDSLGARKTENVFDIRTPVAIAVGLRDGQPQPEVPATVWKVRLTGTEQEKLNALEDAKSITDLDWRECSTEWDAPFFGSGDGAYFDWPTTTDVFPWQQSGVKVGRTWPISVDQQTLERRWRTLVSADASVRRNLFVNRPTGRKVTDNPPALLPAGNPGETSISNLPVNAELPSITGYQYRAFDRQHVIADARLLDRAGPPLWRAHSERQTYITSLLTNVLGTGPAAVATAAIPDLDHFRGSFGAKHVIPLWRDADATQPNVAGGLLARLGKAHGSEVSAERLFAYAYGVLAQPSYVEAFWDELEQPPPRLPIAKDATLFGRVADLGERLLWLHTYGERFRDPAKDRGDLEPGEARCTKPVPPSPLPEGHSYDAAARVLRVGTGPDAGEFAPVAPEVYGYSVSGFRVVKSWLDRRKRERSGRKSSPLDDIRPERWDREFDSGLLQLLWVLEETLRLEPEGAALLAEVRASELFAAAELPAPSVAERQPPGAARASQRGLGL